MMDVSRHRSVETVRGYVRDAEIFKDHAGIGPASAIIELKLQHAQERIIDLTQQLECALCDNADWEEQAKRIALPALVPAPALPAPAWWRRVRAW
jgi:hypothetical protein